MSRGVVGKEEFLVSAVTIERSILQLRGQRVILGGDLGAFYDVEPRVLPGGQTEPGSFSGGFHVRFVGSRMAELEITKCDFKLGRYGFFPLLGKQYWGAGSDMNPLDPEGCRLGIARSRSPSDPVSSD